MKNDLELYFAAEAARYQLIANLGDERAGLIADAIWEMAWDARMLASPGRAITVEQFRDRREAVAGGASR